MSRDPAYLLDILQAARRIREGDEVWRVAEADIPRLIAMLEPLVPPEETSEQ